MVDDKDDRQNWKKTCKKPPMKPNAGKGRKGNERKSEAGKLMENGIIEVKDEELTNELDITNMEMDFETTEIKLEAEDYSGSSKNEQ